MSLRAPTGAPARFLDSAIGHQSDDCLLWPFAKRRGGYGYLCYKGEYIGAHTAVCVAVHGPKPSSEHQVAHSCRVPACINPRHLRWDTVAGNFADKVIHGTHNRGERHNLAKLTAEQIRTIRAQPDRMLKDLAAEFGVVQSMISLIRHRKNWRHVE